jgi:hypothetical protein
MVQPNGNTYRIDMKHMTDIWKQYSLTKIILLDTTTANEIIPNLDSKLHVLPYKVTTDGPSKDKSQMFSMTGLRTDGTIEKMNQ